MMYDWQEAIRKMQHQATPPTSAEQEAQAEEQSEVVENTAMWQAAANLTTAEYSRAIRVRKLTPQGLNNRGT